MKPNAPLSPSEHLVTQDLDVAAGKRETFSGHVFVNGWVTVRTGGAVVCEGTFTCLGLSLEGDASLKCQNLVTNILDIESDTKPARLEATTIKARVVHHTQFALRDFVDRGVVTADYMQHAGRGAEYARGINPLGEDFFEPRTEGDPVVLEVAAIREALRAGKRLFKRMEPLVATRSRTAVAASLREPMVEELMAWVSAHPGPQRATLEALDTEWTERLQTLAVEARIDAVREMKKVLKSPKLADAIDAWRVKLGA